MISFTFSSAFHSRRSNVLATRGMVATSQPLAAQAGLDILRAGGNAADAAVATAAMLNVVEPISTGIGGDMFALYWDANARTMTALNGSGRAPAAASIDELKAQGYQRMPTFTGHAVSIPGAVAGWCDLLERHGRMTPAEVLQPAIETAERGYPVSELIARGWQTQVKKLLRAPDWISGDRDNGPPQPSGHELLIEGRAPRPGEIMRIPTLAETLRGIAAQGKDYIYRGDFARRLSEHVQRYGGWITPEDMAAHESAWETPLTAHYRGVTLYECPPNGQGLAAILAANLASGFDLADMSVADRVHVMIEIMRLAFADALQWVCDPDHVDIPLTTLLSGDYADERRRLISMARANPTVSHGIPRVALPQGADTVYLSVVDGKGNACSFINSLYMGTGTGLVVPGTGVALQNRAALFNLDPTHPNALAPHKRPYQTIIPAMLTRGHDLLASFGVMGGFMQPQGHFQMLVNLIDLGMSPQMALDAARWQLDVAAGGGVGAQEPGGLALIEEGWDFEVLAELGRRGHHLSPVGGFRRGLFGGGQIIMRDPETGVLIAGSDPRKDGCAVGW
ncbi:MAG: gamma-glutamyltransferase family protein [Chloroflexi bacterium]|nr:gamma-glutamyltransferase family protein [Chloroflexota bacterium]